MNITAGEILEALQTALRENLTDDGAVTTFELIEASKGHISEERMRLGIKRLIQEGVLKPVRTHRQDISCRNQSVPGYRLVK